MKQNHLEEPMKPTFAYKCSLRLLRLYPRAWRERYADEAAAVLEERPASLRALFDLFLGMLDAHLHTELFTERKFVMLQRLRNSQIAIFSSFVLFAAFWAIYSLIDSFIYQSGVPIWDLASPAPNYAFVSPLVRILGLFAIMTTLLGGCAFIAVALKQACARNKQNIPAVVCALLSILTVAQFFGLVLMTAVFHSVAQILGLVLPLDALLFLASILLANVFRLRQGIKSAQLSWRFMLPTIVPDLCVFSILFGAFLVFNSNDYLYFFAGKYKLLFIIPVLLIFVGIICCGVVYIARQLRRVEFSPRFLRFTFVLAGLTTLAMSIILSLLLYEAQAIYPHINAQGQSLLSVSLLGVIVVGVALPTMFSCVFLWRGFVARRELVLV